MSNYQKAKQILKDTAKDLKIRYKGDSPAIRMGINDEAYQLSKNCNLSEHQYELLCRYSCELHPKN